MSGRKSTTRKGLTRPSVFRGRRPLTGLDGILGGIVGPGGKTEDEASPTSLTLFFTFSEPHHLTRNSVQKCWPHPGPSPAPPLAPSLLTEPTPVSPPVWTTQVSHVVLLSPVFHPEQAPHRPQRQLFRMSVWLAYKHSTCLSPSH